MEEVKKLISMAGLSNRTNYKVAPYVVEIEVQPKIKLEKYDRDIQCEIIDSKKAERLVRI